MKNRILPAMLFMLCATVVNAQNSSHKMTEAQKADAAKADVYINGRLLGTHEGGFTPFQFEVTDKIFDGDNFIVIKTDNTRYPDNVPAENFDWWNYGGITRDVKVIEVSKTYIKDYFIQLKKNSLNETHMKEFF